jgi:hypothetical protein
MHAYTFADMMENLASEGYFECSVESYKSAVGKYDAKGDSFDDCENLSVVFKATDLGQVFFQLRGGGSSAPLVVEQGDILEVALSSGQRHPLYFKITHANIPTSEAGHAKLLTFSSVTGIFPRTYS